MRFDALLLSLGLVQTGKNQTFKLLLSCEQRMKKKYDKAENEQTKNKKMRVGRLLQLYNFQSLRCDDMNSGGMSTRTVYTHYKNPSIPTKLKNQKVKLTLVSEFALFSFEFVVYIIHCRVIHNFTRSFLNANAEMVMGNFSFHLTENIIRCDS